MIPRYRRRSQALSQHERNSIFRIVQSFDTSNVHNIVTMDIANSRHEDSIPIHTNEYQSEDLYKHQIQVYDASINASSVVHLLIRMLPTP